MPIQALQDHSLSVWKLSEWSKIVLSEHSRFFQTAVLGGKKVMQEETHLVAKCHCLFMVLIIHTPCTTRRWQNDGLALCLMWLWVPPHMNDTLIADCLVDVIFIEYAVYDSFQSDMYSAWWLRKALLSISCWHALLYLDTLNLANFLNRKNNCFLNCTSTSHISLHVSEWIDTRVFMTLYTL